MKKIFLTMSTALILAGVGGLAGCEKQQEAKDLEQTVVSRQHSQSIISEQDLESVLNEVLPQLPPDQKAIIERVEGGYTLKLVPNDMTTVAEDQAKPYCKSADYNVDFMNCVARNVKLVGCVQVYTSGGYWYGGPCE